MLSLTAKRVHADFLDRQTFVLAFAEHADGSGGTITFQVGEPNESDVALGEDTYCVMVNGEDLVYGGVSSWTCEAGRFSFTLEPEKARELELEEQVEIFFAKDLTKRVRAAMMVITDED